MRMRLEAKFRCLPSPLNHPCKARCGERRTTFAGEHKRRLGLLLSLHPAQRSQFIAPDRMVAGRALLDPTNSQSPGVEIDLIPSQINKLSRTEASPIPQRRIGRLHSSRLLQPNETTVARLIADGQSA
jgi:hypothetical protein